MNLFRPSLAVAAFLTFCVTARAQTAPLPPAPAPTKPTFALPPGTVVAESHGTTPPSQEDADTFCDGARYGVYSKENTTLAGKEKQQMQGYVDNITYQIGDVWRKHMPIEAKSAWAKGKIVAVRFAINPNGSYSEPIVTLSSGHASYDKNAVNAIYTFAAFPPLPEGIKRPYPMCIRFGYNESFGPAAPKPFDTWPGKAKPVPMPDPKK